MKKVKKVSKTLLVAGLATASLAGLLGNSLPAEPYAHAAIYEQRPAIEQQQVVQEERPSQFVIRNDHDSAYNVNYGHGRQSNSHHANATLSQSDYRNSINELNKKYEYMFELKREMHNIDAKQQEFWILNELYQRELRQIVAKWVGAESDHSAIQPIVRINQDKVKSNKTHQSNVSTRDNNTHASTRDNNDSRNNVAAPSTKNVKDTNNHLGVDRQVDNNAVNNIGNSVVANDSGSHTVRGRTTREQRIDNIRNRYRQTHDDVLSTVNALKKKQKVAPKPAPVVPTPAPVTPAPLPAPLPLPSTRPAPPTTPFTPPNVSTQTPTN